MPCSCPLVHKDFRKYSNREPRAQKKSLHYSGNLQRHLPDPVRPAIPCLPCPRRQLHCACVWPYGMPVIRPHRRAPHPRTDPAAKVFGREGRGEGEPFSKKVSLLASCSLFTSSIVCLPSPKQKNPRRSGDKKRPPRAESCKGVSNNLWQRPTFPHDVMQYHRRWRA